MSYCQPSSRKGTSTATIINTPTAKLMTSIFIEVNTRILHRFIDSYKYLLAYSGSDVLKLIMLLLTLKNDTNNPIYCWTLS